MATTECSVDLTATLDYLKGIFVDLYPVIYSAEWKNWPMEDQVKLNQLMRKIDNVFQGDDKGKNGLRPKYDKTIWEGHDDGTVSADIESVRTRRAEGSNPPGRKPVVKTTDEIFDSL